MSGLAPKGSPPLDSGEGKPANAVSETPSPVEKPFSIFTEWQKRWISSAASFGALFSTLSSYIYLPALVPMARDLRISLTLMNLTVTSYMIVAGLAPAFMGDMADQSGRRPVYILMFALMLGANIGMAVQTSYPALLVLRMLQSAGSSGTYGAAYGVIADIAQVSERGSYVGTLILCTTTAPTLGPVIGGILTEKLGWRWIFWFLVILTGTHFIVLLLFLPETQRKLVGNGSRPARGIYRSVFSAMLVEKKFQENAETVAETPKRRHHFPNPLACIPVLFDKASVSIIMVGSITYLVKMTLQTSLAAQCIDIYRLNYLQAGLIYLPSGVGGAIASHITGKLLDANFRKKTIELGLEGLKRGDDISGFPIEATRLKGIYALSLISIGGIIGYGVALTTKAHISVMLIMQFLTGAATSSVFTMCGTLLTDLNPKRSATAQAAYNLVRCLGAGAGIAALEPLVDAIDSGWTFGIYAILMFSQIPLAWLLISRGMEWRRSQDERGTTSHT
ncbi:major facilitator superfamily domain-containing protein [Xylariomycetidae sp. FL2044]|nr:major facilitator superfamily domain-containing protein [Xylariomycetidae sp. FL2044]